MHNVISSGSEGNCVIYHSALMVDIGIPFSLIKPFMYDIQIVLLTHKHPDHLNGPTLEKLQSERPTLRIALGECMLPYVKHLKNLDVLEVGSWYDYGGFKISPIQLYHDVPNVGWRIFKGDHKTIHCTDTAHLSGVEAKNYNLYALEHNYDEETIFDKIRAKEASGEYCYEKGAIETHLSEQQAQDFIFKNKGKKYDILRLHESK